MLKDFSLSDVKSGFLIFLIALPLSLGIAAASSFPPIAGIMTAIVGAFVASFLGSSRLTIKGPAAGLIVIVFGAVQDLGQGNVLAGYQKCLGICVAAAVLQIIFSRIGAGKVGNLMPPSVVHGMLAAIGVIIMAKQFHVLLGVVPHGKTPLDLIAEIPETLALVNPEIAFIGILTLLSVVLIPFIPIRMTQKIPSALIALILVLPLALYWHLDSSHDYSFWNTNYHVGPNFLVNLPANLLSAVTFPDFSALASVTGLKYVMMFALVGSLESLLTVTAIDSLDPKKQKSDLNADLFAVGVGNLASALVGGLPMISEVVRSKANIDNGAQSKWSNVFHGVFLLLAVTLFVGVIHEIPLAALAAMLMITGFRLSSPKEFYKTYRVGFDQLILFSVTLLITISTDLLMGVFAGILLKFILHILRGVQLRNLFSMPIVISEKGGSCVMTVKGQAIFSNYLYLVNQLEKNLRTHKKVVLDFSETSLIDHTTLHHIKGLCDFHKEKLETVGLHVHKRLSAHELATHKLV